MNAARRKQITEIVAQIEKLRELRDSIAEQIDTVKDDEQVYYDAMPESIQAGDKGQRAEAAVSALEEAHSELDGFDLDAILGSLETASE